MTRLVAKPATRLAAARRGLLLIESELATEQPKTVGEQAQASVEQAPPALDDVAARFRRHLANLDSRLRFPNAFREPPVPLKVGIGRDLADAMIAADGEYGPADLRAFMKWWTGRVDYLAAVVRGQARVDLLGRVVAVPTAAERAFAAAKLAKVGGGR